MKNRIIIILLLLAQVTFSQVKRDLGDFDSLKVFDKLTVNLIASDKNYMEVVGNRANEVEIVNKNGELKIRMPFPKLLSGDDIKIKLYFKNLESIAANEGSLITSESTFKQTKMEVSVSAGSQINLDLNVQKADLSANTGGIIDITGKATNQNVVINTGGVYNGKELESTQTTVTISAGGQAEVFATLLVDAKVRAGGSIDIYGKPKQINQKTVLGGTISEK